MSGQLSHQAIEELLGAYALDAVDADERDAVELHLRDCPRCRAEVAEHREVAALLAHSGSSAPEGVWGKILDELEPAPPALRVTVAPDTGVAGVAPLATVVSLADRRRSVSMRIVVAVVAAAAAIVAVLGVVNVHQSQRLDRMQTALGAASTSVPGQPAPKIQTKLTSANGDISAKAIVNRDGRGYLLGAKALPATGPGHTYQLWGRIDSTVISLGTFSGRDDVVQFQLDKQGLGGLNALMVTNEQSPGVAQTKNNPLIIGTI